MAEERARRDALVAEQAGAGEVEAAASRVGDEGAKLREEVSADEEAEAFFAEAVSDNANEVIWESGQYLIVEIMGVTVE